MDLSKLPKLSKTSESQPPINGTNLTPADPPQTPPPFLKVHYPVAPASIGFAEAWISIGLGILLLFIFHNTISYLHSPADFAQNNSVTDAQGNTISYPASAYFWTDLGVTILALALILEGIALATIRKTAPLWIAFTMTVLAAIFNVIVIAHAQPLIGFPIFCGVGVVILGYMAMTQWRLISALRR